MMQEEVLGSCDKARVREGKESIGMDQDSGLKGMNRHLLRYIDEFISLDELEGVVYDLEQQQQYARSRLFEGKDNQSKEQNEFKGQQIGNNDLFMQLQDKLKTGKQIQWQVEQISMQRGISLYDADEAEQLVLKLRKEKLIMEKETALLQHVLSVHKFYLKIMKTLKLHGSLSLPHSLQIVEQILAEDTLGERVDLDELNELYVDLLSISELISLLPEAIRIQRQLHLNYLEDKLSLAVWINKAQSMIQATTKSQLPFNKFIDFMAQRPRDCQKAANLCDNLEKMKCFHVEYSNAFDNIESQLEEKRVASFSQEQLLQLQSAIEKVNQKYEEVPQFLRLDIKSKHQLIERISEMIKMISSTKNVIQERVANISQLEELLHTQQINQKTPVQKLLVQNIADKIALFKKSNAQLALIQDVIQFKTVSSSSEPKKKFPVQFFIDLFDTFKDLNQFIQVDNQLAQVEDHLKNYQDEEFSLLKLSKGWINKINDPTLQILQFKADLQSIKLLMKNSIFEWGKYESNISGLDIVLRIKEYAESSESECGWSWKKAIDLRDEIVMQEKKDNYVVKMFEGRKEFLRMIDELKAVKIELENANKRGVTIERVEDMHRILTNSFISCPNEKQRVQRMRITRERVMGEIKEFEQASIKGEKIVMSRVQDLIELIKQSSLKLDDKRILLEKKMQGATQLIKGLNNFNLETLIDQYNAQTIQIQVIEDIIKEDMQLDGELNMLDQKMGECFDDYEELMEINQNIFSVKIHFQHKPLLNLIKQKTFCLLTLVVWKNWNAKDGKDAQNIFGYNTLKQIVLESHKYDLPNLENREHDYSLEYNIFDLNLVAQIKSKAKQLPSKRQSVDDKEDIEKIYLDDEELESDSEEGNNNEELEHRMKIAKLSIVNEKVQVNEKLLKECRDIISFVWQQVLEKENSIRNTTRLMDLEMIEQCGTLRCVDLTDIIIEQKILLQNMMEVELENNKMEELQRIKKKSEEEEAIKLTEELHRRKLEEELKKKADEEEQKKKALEGERKRREEEKRLLKEDLFGESSQKELDIQREQKISLNEQKKQNKALTIEETIAQLINRSCFSIFDLKHKRIAEQMANILITNMHFKDLHLDIVAKVVQYLVKQMIQTGQTDDEMNQLLETLEELKEDMVSSKQLRKEMFSFKCLLSMNQDNSNSPHKKLKKNENTSDEKPQKQGNVDSKKIIDYEEYVGISCKFSNTRAKDPMVQELHRLIQSKDTLALFRSSNLSELRRMAGITDDRETQAVNSQQQQNHTWGEKESKQKIEGHFSSEEEDEQTYPQGKGQMHTRTSWHMDPIREDEIDNFVQFCNHQLMLKYSHYTGIQTSQLMYNPLAKEDKEDEIISNLKDNDYSSFISPTEIQDQTAKLIYKFFEGKIHLRSEMTQPIEGVLFLESNSSSISECPTFKSTESTIIESGESEIWETKEFLLRSYNSESILSLFGCVQSESEDIQKQFDSIAQDLKNRERVSIALWNTATKVYFFHRNLFQFDSAAFRLHKKFELSRSELCFALIFKPATLKQSEVEQILRIDSNKLTSFTPNDFLELHTLSLAQNREEQEFKNVNTSTSLFNQDSKFKKPLTKSTKYRKDTITKTYLPVKEQNNQSNTTHTISNNNILGILLNPNRSKEMQSQIELMDHKMNFQQQFRTSKQTDISQKSSSSITPNKQVSLSLQITLHFQKYLFQDSFIYCNLHQIIYKNQEASKELEEFFRRKLDGKSTVKQSLNKLDAIQLRIKNSSEPIKEQNIASEGEKILHALSGQIDSLQESLKLVIAKRTALQLNNIDENNENQDIDNIQEQCLDDDYEFDDQEDNLKPSQDNEENVSPLDDSLDDSNKLSSQPLANLCQLPKNSHFREDDILKVNQMNEDDDEEVQDEEEELLKKNVFQQVNRNMNFLCDDDDHDDNDNDNDNDEDETPKYEKSSLTKDSIARNRQKLLEFASLLDQIKPSSTAFKTQSASYEPINFAENQILEEEDDRQQNDEQMEDQEEELEYNQEGEIQYNEDEEEEYNQEGKIQYNQDEEMEYEDGDMEYIEEGEEMEDSSYQKQRNYQRQSLSSHVPQGRFNPRQLPVDQYFDNKENNDNQIRQLQSQIEMLKQKIMPEELITPQISHTKESYSKVSVTYEQNNFGQYSGKRSFNTFDSYHQKNNNVHIDNNPNQFNTSNNHTVYHQNHSYNSHTKFNSSNNYNSNAKFNSSHNFNSHRKFDSQNRFPSDGRTNNNNYQSQHERTQIPINYLKDRRPEPHTPWKGTHHSQNNFQNNQKDQFSNSRTIKEYRDNQYSNNANFSHHQTSTRQTISFYPQSQHYNSNGANKFTNKQTNQSNSSFRPRYN